MCVENKSYAGPSYQFDKYVVRYFIGFEMFNKRFQNI